MLNVGDIQCRSAPSMFCWLMGFWKKMTDATMTMTRFRQFPIECVTGDTLCRII